MPAQGIGGRVFAGWARRHYTPAAVEQAIVDADRRLGIDLATIDLHAPLAASKTCTLLLHGARDHFIPVAASRGLAAAAPQVRYSELPLESHMSLPLRVGWLADPLATWMAGAAAGTCAPLVLPADPAQVLPAGKAGWEPIRRRALRGVDRRHERGRHRPSLPPSPRVAACATGLRRRTAPVRSR
jgi:hypothetical protein